MIAINSKENSFVTIIFSDFGGCMEVRSFTIEYGVQGFSQQSVDIPWRETLSSSGVGLSLPFGQNSIVAIARCADGSLSEKSNVVEVTSAEPTPTASPNPPPPAFYLDANGSL